MSGAFLSRFTPSVLSPETLEAIWPLIVPGGGVVIDDCVEPAWCDGALQACREFSQHHDLRIHRAGGKGAVLKKS